jgi:PAS domain-containing protein
MREGLVLHEIIYNERGNPVDFRYLDVNPVFERMTGLLRDDLVGKLLSETPRWYDSDWPGDYLKVAFSGKPYRVEIFIPDLDRHFDIVAFRPQTVNVLRLFPI